MHWCEQLGATARSSGPPTGLPPWAGFGGAVRWRPAGTGRSSPRSPIGSFEVAGGGPPAPGSRSDRGAIADAGPSTAPDGDAVLVGSGPSTRDWPVTVDDGWA